MGLLSFLFCFSSSSRSPRALLLRSTIAALSAGAMPERLMGGGFLTAGEDDNEPGGFVIENEDRSPIAGGGLLCETGDGGLPWLVGMGPLEVNLLGVGVLGLLEPARARTASVAAPRRDMLS
jgi:hypothetical protein